MKIYSIIAKKESSNQFYEAGKIEAKNMKQAKMLAIKILGHDKLFIEKPVIKKTLSINPIY
jgi:hypothetical protein